MSIPDTQLLRTDHLQLAPTLSGRTLSGHNCDLFLHIQKSLGVQRGVDGDPLHMRVHSHGWRMGAMYTGLPLIAGPINQRKWILGWTKSTPGPFNSPLDKPFTELLFDSTLSNQGKNLQFSD